MVGCKDVLIDGIRILNNLRLASSDGIDPDHCQNVRITNCHIESADDCTSAAIKIGTESEAPFRNIVVQNCNISKTNRGISLQLRDGGYIENVLFSNINIETRHFSQEHWWGGAEPIAVTALPRKETTKLGYIRNVHFENINCCSENGILIYGENQESIRGLTFHNITMHLTAKTDWKRDYHDLRPTYKVDVVTDQLYAVYARNASNVKISGFTLEVDEMLQKEMGNPYNIQGCEEVRILSGE